MLADKSNAALGRRKGKEEPQIAAAMLSDLRVYPDEKRKDAFDCSSVSYVTENLRRVASHLEEDIRLVSAEEMPP